MKNYLILAAAATLALTSCNKKELADASNTNDSLITVVNARDASLTEFIDSFNDVERNLDSVAARQHIITISSDQPGELKGNQKARVNAEIAAINNLMNENRKKLASLSSKLKNSGYKNAALEKTIATLTNQLEQKDLELTALNEKLNNLNAQVAQLETAVTTLVADNGMKSQTIADETAALHTAYYIVGKSKELQDDNIIDRKGGLLGMGKTSKLSSDIDVTKLTRIDYTQTIDIAINSKDVKIVTSHPSDSYVLVKDFKNEKMVTSLMIKNPEKFWSASKYLVIIKD